MEEEQQSPNPFASPVVVSAASIPEFDPGTEIREFNFGTSLLKWILICGISGAPSFFVAFSLGDDYAVQTTAMVLGILTYVAFYVYIESREWTRRKLANKSIRIAVRIGYITRVTISIMFPIAMTLDMICGMISVSMTSSVFGEDIARIGSYETETISTLPVVFLWFYLTTLLQGLILNIVLGAYTLIVYAFTLLVRSGSKN